MSAATLDLIFTSLMALSLLGIAGVGVLALPWSASDAHDTAKALDVLVRLPAAWLRSRRTRRPAAAMVPAGPIALRHIAH